MGSFICVKNVSGFIPKDHFWEGLINLVVCSFFIHITTFTSHFSITVTVLFFFKCYNQPSDALKLEITI